MSGVPGPTRQSQGAEDNLVKEGSSHPSGPPSPPHPELELVCLSSSDDEDEVEVIDPAVEVGSGTRFVPREVMIQKHPWCRGLSFKKIIEQAVDQDKFLPHLDEQVLPEEFLDRMRESGFDVQKSSGGDGGTIISAPSRGGNDAAPTMYYSSFSARLEPVLEDPVLENYVQEYRKTIPVPVGGQPGHPGVSAKSPLGVDEDGEEELLQGTVSAWVVTDPRGNLVGNANATPSVPGFLGPGPHSRSTKGRSYPGTGSSFEGEGHMKKKRKQKSADPDPGESVAGPSGVVWNFHESSRVQPSGSSAILPRGGGHGGGSRSSKSGHFSEG